ncbi:D-alanyl-D-alanine carboxypeptidase/D-alanyl-D-alanine endopeptidase [Kocuria rosea]|uniref:D-alanyl-D-alanine carboxypeptidase/D-alanyl-D-alanine endopeptidase n=1 Tax=Kocuria rosea TaxID=1275 RepID=UPI00203D477E|nr:D-alanyl-D-alanine carboxypeptidase/D-alanyl-D-alanine-endopeptidase [Kocuria rosea]MCM3688038.1 D-alanyl-D-alanine carboxypeptidase/D-alanyl-D-alanine-endopeptidase [Kocuria rosea]
MSSSRRRGASAPRTAAALLAAGCVGVAAWLHPHWAPLLGPGGDAVSAARSVPADPPAPAGAVRPDPAAPAPAPGEVAAAVDAALAGVPAGRRSALVADALTGQPLLERDADAALVPASNQKLVTLLSLLAHADPGERLRTRVLAGEDPATVVLVAGGDTLLSSGRSDPAAVMGRAGIRTLAERTARELAARGITGPVTVRWDAGLFAGPALNDAWAAEDVAAGRIGPVAPMAFWSHRVPDGDGPGAARPQEPARDVAAVLAAELRELRPAGPGGPPAVTIAPGRAPAGAEELAAVESATLAEQARLMVQDSDNHLAEVLSRLAAAAAGHPGSIAGGRAAAAEALAAHGVPAAGAELSDASGMSLRNRLSARTLEHVVRAMATDGTGALAPGARALPVAGGGGTLADRFDDAPEHPGQGVVRAKTGTLYTVVSLSGHVTTDGGRLLTFSVLLGDVSDPAAARDAVDRAVAALARL